MHPAALCNLKVSFVSPRNSWISWISLPELLFFHTHTLIHSACCPKGKKVLCVCRKALSNCVLFWYFLSCTPGKHIKSPAKFQEPLLTAWPPEVCPNISCHHGDWRTMFLHTFLHKLFQLAWKLGKILSFFSPFFIVKCSRKELKKTTKDIYCGRVWLWRIWSVWVDVSSLPVPYPSKCLHGRVSSCTTMNVCCQTAAFGCLLRSFVEIWFLWL